MFETVFSDPSCKLGLSFQEYCAVLRLFADLGVLIEIANVTAGPGGQVFEFREGITKLCPRIRVKFTEYLSLARENARRTFQDTDFSTLGINFYEAGLW
jgi:hypothetical protein